MEVLIAATAVLIGRARTNTGLVLGHGMNKIMLPSMLKMRNLKCQV